MADSPAYQLVHRVYAGAVDLAPLRILDSRTIDWAGLRVTFHVLGASHAVTIEGPGVHITELLACTAPPETSISPLLETPVCDWHEAGSKTASIDFGTMVNMVKMIATHWPQSEKDTLSGEYAPDSRLEVPFPAEPGHETPWTRIGWITSPVGAQPTVLRVETVHTYPEEARAVRTISKFTREAAP